MMCVHLVFLVCLCTFGKIGTSCIGYGPLPAYAPLARSGLQSSPPPVARAIRRIYYPTCIHSLATDHRDWIS
ncbi:hypothetical protein F4805DRAFT_423679 [Annulohypoxylon moriforme]|nr:hypothetical protein F4805DRAFT_423679 [Annulohypoxylon moriforme]